MCVIMPNISPAIANIYVTQHSIVHLMVHSVPDVLHMLKQQSYRHTEYFLRWTIL